MLYPPTHRVGRVCPRRFTLCGFTSPKSYAELSREENWLDRAGEQDAEGLGELHGVREGDLVRLGQVLKDTILN